MPIDPYELGTHWPDGQSRIPFVDTTTDPETRRVLDACLAFWCTVEHDIDDREFKTRWIHPVETMRRKWTDETLLLVVEYVTRENVFWVEHGCCDPMGLWNTWQKRDSALPQRFRGWAASRRIASKITTTDTSTTTGADWQNQWSAVLEAWRTARSRYSTFDELDTLYRDGLAHLSDATQAAALEVVPALMNNSELDAKFTFRGAYERRAAQGMAA